jgi:ElaB/YqjD/DUF883 family membrane-anchored ribosome-binding protein
MAAVEEVNTDIGQIKQDLVTLRSDLGTLMSTLKDMGIEQGRVAYSRAREVGSAAAGQAVTAQQNMEHYIEARPISSVLVAFGTGFALGTILSTRH